MDKIKEYFTTDRISNSFLSTMLTPRLVWMKKNKPELFEDEEFAYFRIGSAVDCLLTSPDRWGNDFVVGDVYKPYGMMGTFVANLPPALNEESPLELYQKAYSKAGYKKDIEWVVSQFWSNPKSVEYYRFIKDLPENKIGLSKDEYLQVLQCKEALETNEFTRPYFHAQSGEVLMHQVPIYFDYELDGDLWACKALLDGIKLNHEAKTIQPFDLKTTGKSVFEFENSFLHFGYYRQAAYYELALTSAASPVRPLIDAGYTVEDYIFIVAETRIDSYNPALIYRTCLNDRLAGLNGGKAKGKYYPGVNDLLRAYKWHTDVQIWELPKQVYDNAGEIELSLFGN